MKQQETAQCFTHLLCICQVPDINVEMDLLVTCLTTDTMFYTSFPHD